MAYLLRDVTIGGASKKTLLRRLQEQSVSLNDYTNMLFEDTAFTTSAQAREDRGSVARGPFTAGRPLPNRRLAKDKKRQLSERVLLAAARGRFVAERLPLDARLRMDETWSREHRFVFLVS